MKAVEPCSEADAAEIQAIRRLWEYSGPGDIGDPFEPNPCNWGRLDGRLVAVDYAANVDGE